MIAHERLMTMALTKNSLNMFTTLAFFGTRPKQRDTTSAHTPNETRFLENRWSDLDTELGRHDIIVVGTILTSTLNKNTYWNPSRQTCFDCRDVTLYLTYLSVGSTHECTAAVFKNLSL